MRRRIAALFSALRSVLEGVIRCYLMRRGGIASVEFLEAGSDEGLIQQAGAIFEARKSERFDGFEVWDGNRRVHVQASVAPVDGA